jgi:hypothetical protein
MGIKNAESDADFEFAEKLPKTHAKKLSLKSDKEMEFLTFSTVCKSVLPIYLLCIL